MADIDYLSREQAESLAQRILGFATADETRVSIRSGWSGNTTNGHEQGHNRCRAYGGRNGWQHLAAIRQRCTLKLVQRWKWRCLTNLL